jgi:hypothetical protein
MDALRAALTSACSRELSASASWMLLAMATCRTQTHSLDSPNLQAERRGCSWWKRQVRARCVALFRSEGGRSS